MHRNDFLSWAIGFCHTDRNFEMTYGSDNIQAKSISIVDDNGSVKAFLGPVQRAEGTYEPCLVMYDSQGFPRLEVGMSADDPLVIMSLPDGSTSISIGSLREEVKGIMISDKKGSPCVIIQSQEAGSSVVFYQRDNNVLRIVKSYPE